MGGLLNALRSGGNDAIRQSTSLTTAYLLEQNRKFEAYMREKVAVLEGRVAGQQARLASHEMEDFDDGSTGHRPEWDEGLAEVLEWPGPEDTSSAGHEAMDVPWGAAPAPKVLVEPVMGFDGLEEPDDEDDEAPRRRDEADTPLESTVSPGAVPSPVSEEPPDRPASPRDRPASPRDWMAAFGVASAQPDDDLGTGDEEAEPVAEIVQGGAVMEAEDASSQVGDDLETGDEEAEPVQGDADLEIEDDEGDEPGLFGAPYWQAGEEGVPIVPVAGGVLGLTAISQRQSPQEEYLAVELTTNHQGIEDLEDEMGDWDASLPGGPVEDYV